METIENTSGCPAAISQLIESSKTLDNGELVEHLKWIPYSEFTNIESIEHSTSNQPTYYATYERAKEQHDYLGRLLSSSSYKVEMLLLGTVDECTQEFITEFTRIYSLPTHKYDNPPNIVQFR